MLDKVQQQINALQTGKKLILGAGIEIHTMQSIVDLCQQLESNGVIRIINKHQESKTGQKLIDSLLIEKS
ncbi:hypothetical protein B9T31_14125 [Acinetobacter sp. ANC 4558]|uniref:hypothetical protein n=1 Tax=Acinetobacter sp. ANC 4558 TaxID=1977876 RepID=UPI000A340ECD|nr:hypothetical protein [Acinetobacter sp. ANC 4558]OTG83223.1 hypothetical protein B9T31_14125 [Acinetobacter sp. ANC 4558]